MQKFELIRETFAKKERVGFFRNNVWKTKNIRKIEN